MKKLIIILSALVLFSCENEPEKMITLKVYFENGKIDTLNIRYFYEIDQNGNLGSTYFGDFKTIATKVKYVKELK